MTPLTIAPAYPSDLSAVHSMICDLCAFHGDTAQVDLAHLNRMHFAKSPTVTALVAKRDGTTVGYAGLTWFPVIHEASLRFDIHHLFVRRPHRRRGVATALIGAARAHVVERGGTGLTIGTDPKNDTAISAYRAMDMLDEITGSGPRFRVALPL